MVPSPNWTAGYRKEQSNARSAVGAMDREHFGQGYIDLIEASVAEAIKQFPGGSNTITRMLAA